MDTNNLARVSARVRAAALVTLLVSVSSAFGQASWRTANQLDSEPVAAEIDRMLRRAADDGFGGAVVIERAGRVLLARGYGLANREARIPFTVDTIAPISSVTKTFTALAVVQLAAQGELDLQQPLKIYLVGASEPAASARIHDVLLHHAGLPEYCGDDFVRRTKPQLLTVCAARALTSTRGTYAYSNAGYSLLAALVEEVSGLSWEDLLRRSVFVPAGMTRTGLLFPARPARDFADGYVDDRPQGVEADRIAALQGDVWNLKGSGGLQASAQDMHRFYKFLMQQSEGIRVPMTTPHEGDGGGAGIQGGYGLAFRTDSAGQIYRVGHSGSDGVFMSYFMWLPQDDTFMYFVGNNGEERVRPVLNAIVNVLGGVRTQPSAVGGCELPESTVLRREGNAVLEVWDLPAVPVWFGKTVPDAPGYAAYRAAIRTAGGDQLRPAADPPKPDSAAQRELWRREDLNSALMYAGGGEVRPTQCLEMALFAVQDARYSELTHPTEFVVHILRKDDRLKVYFGASDQMFPPKDFYGLKEIAAEVAGGWQYWVVLHNHTVRTFEGKPALGTPAPSTSDVELFRALVADLGLREVWVTNGMYTGVVPAANLGQFSTRE